MPQEILQPPYEQLRLIPQEREVTHHAFQLGREIARRLNDGDEMLFDVDGVFLEADSLERPTPTSTLLLRNVREIERLGYKVGLATARPARCMEYFQNEHGLKLEGLSIFEGGQHRIFKGESEFLAGEHVREFMRDAHYYMQLMPEYVSNWGEVQAAYAQGLFAFTQGREQWQGDLRRSLWFRSTLDKEDDDRILLHYFDRILESIAKERNINYRREMHVTVDHMTSGNNLGIIEMKGTRNGIPINKGTALHGVPGNFVFIADGMGDRWLGYLLKRRGNLVIGVEGNMDSSLEPCVFLQNADGVVKDPQELAAALTVTVAHLR